MEAIIRRCAGLDVHKKSITVCVSVLEEHGKPNSEVRTFATMTRHLETLRDWLLDRQVTHVAMESTGVLWKPVFNILEDHFTILLCNARHIKAVPGRKTDVKDAEWIAQLLQHGLLTGSFIPPRAQRDLRDLTRHRAQLTDEKARQVNRIHKILEDANIKFGAVATDIMGVSGRDMLRALIAGSADAGQMADLARRRMRGKIPELREALHGRVTEHHRYMLGLHLRHVEQIEEMIAELDERIGLLMSEGKLDSDEATPMSDAQQEPPQASPMENPSCEPRQEPSETSPMKNSSSDSVANTAGAQVQPPLPFAQAVELLDEMPGIDVVSALEILAEIGTNMKQFPDGKHLASWACICPGNEESAGKHKSGKTGKGNRWLSRVLCQAAWAASHTKDTYLAAQYRRLAKTRGKKRAIIAVGHSMLIAIYHMLAYRQHYNELGAKFFDQLDPERITRYHVKRLESLGFAVTLEKAA